MIRDVSNRKMASIKSDLYRNFGIGFLIGTLMVGASLAHDLSADIAAPAFAATADQTDGATNENS